MTVNDPDIKYFLGKLSGSMEAIQQDVNEIKQAQIVNGKHRMEKVETKVQSLNVWKNTAVAVTATFGLAITWTVTHIQKILEVFHG